jgi:hypothetical protein
MSETQKQAKEMAVMLQNSTESAKEYLDRALPILTENLKRLRSGDPQSGLATIGEATDGLTWILDYLGNAALALPESEAALAADITENAKNLTQAVHLMVDAMTSQDYALLGDVTEFELLESLSHTQNLIDRILHKTH